MKNFYRIMIVGLWIGFFLITFTLYSIGNYVRFDFSVYYRAAVALHNGAPLYNGAVGMVYLYPPLLAQFLASFVAIFSFEVVAGFWFVVNGIILIGICAILYRQIDNKSEWFWIMPVFFAPFWETLYIGQVTIIMLALLVGAWWCIREDKPILGGILIALSIWIKIFPAVIVVYFLINRQWKPMFGIVMGIIGFGLLQILISGPDVLIDYQKVLLELFVVGQDGNNFKNHSILGFSSRLFLETYKSHELFISQLMFSLVRWGLSLIILVTTIFLIYSPNNQDVKRFDLSYTMILITAVLLSSTVWMSGLVFLYFGYIVALKYGEKIPGVKLIVLASYLMVVVFHFIDLGLNREGLPALVLSLGFYGMLALWGLLGFMLFNIRGTRIEPSKPV